MNPMLACVRIETEDVTGSKTLALKNNVTSKKGRPPNVMPERDWVSQAGDDQSDRVNSSMALVTIRQKKMQGSKTMTTRDRKWCKVKIIWQYMHWVHTSETATKQTKCHWCSLPLCVSSVLPLDGSNSQIGPLVKSEQFGAEHNLNCGDDSGLPE